MPEERMLRKDAMEMADDILSMRGDRVTDREKEFLEGLYEKSKYPDLTEKMTSWLNAIYDRVMK